MRPMEPIIRQWIKEKDSFSVRGLVMYRDSKYGWSVNCELLRITREDIDKEPVEKAAYEIALSAISRYMTGVPGRTSYDGDTTPVNTPRGQVIEVPALSLELAEYLKGKVIKLIEDGGGGLPLTVLAKAGVFHARATTGNAKDAEAWNLPKLDSRAVRIVKRMAYEAKIASAKESAMAVRRRQLAKFWTKHKLGFMLRGLVYGKGQDGFWQFNVHRFGNRLDPVPFESNDEEKLLTLAMEVSAAAIKTFATAVNVERDGVRTLRSAGVSPGLDSALTDDMVAEATHRLANRLLHGMKKYGHGIVGHATIERSLVEVWDPENKKSLEEYPFPLAPTEAAGLLDRWALKILHERQSFYRDQSAAATKAGIAPVVQQPRVDPTAQSGREELEIPAWVPLEVPQEDDETIDRRAMQLADHQQSSALRRIRDGSRYPQ